VLKKYQYKLTREEVIQAVSMWVQDKHREKGASEPTPEAATDPDKTVVFVRSAGASNVRTLRVQSKQPLCVEWEVLEGAEP